MKHTLFTFLAASLMSLAAQAQTEVAPFRPGVTVDGVCYFLPKMTFEIVVTADKAVTLPGDFATYADRYLRQTDVPKTESTLWTLKDVKLLAYGVPDSTKAYSVKLRAKTSAPLLSISPEGLLLGINADVTPEKAPELPASTPAPTPVNGRSFMSRDILSAGSTSKMAQLTADEIYDLRESRTALIRGEADNTPKDGAQLKLMLDQLDAQANGLETLFKGQTLTSTEVTSFDYEPAPTLEAEGEKQLLCRFSRRLGLVDRDDLSGEPVWISMRQTSNLPTQLENAETAKKKGKIEQGVYYNVPARVQVTIYTAERTLWSGDVMMPQYGTVEILSDALFNKKLDTQVIFDQNTGMYKSLK